jgi:hypothetical protein
MRHIFILPMAAALVFEPLAFNSDRAEAMISNPGLGRLADALSPIEKAGCWRCIRGAAGEATVGGTVIMAEAGVGIAAGTTGDGGSETQARGAQIRRSEPPRRSPAPSPSAGRRGRADPSHPWCRTLAVDRSGAMGLRRVPGLDLETDVEPRIAGDGLSQAEDTKNEAGELRLLVVGLRSFTDC